MLKPELSELIKTLPRGDYRNGLHWWWLNRDAPQHLYLLVGTHGQEYGGTLTLPQLLVTKQLVEQKWCWPNVSVLCVLQDPRGFAQEGYGFVGPDGESSMWPPLWRHPKNEEMYWFYKDENSAWGDTVNISPRHRQMRDLMEEKPPTFMLTLHETVRSEIWRDIFWAGAGLLLIEVYPMSLTEYGGVVDPIGSPNADPLMWAVRTLREWLSPLWKERRWVRARKSLEGNPHFQLVSKIAEQYFDEYGQRLTGDAWMRYQEAMGQPTIGPGRILHTPEMLQSEWKTASDFCVGRYGATAITTESFACGEMGLRGVDQRVEAQVKFVQSVLDVLNDRSPNP